MFVNGSGPNVHSLERTFYRCFLPSFSSFGWGVSEEKIKMWKVNERQMTDDGQRSTDAKWWQKLTLPLARWAKKHNVGIGQCIVSLYDSNKLYFLVAILDFIQIQSILKVIFETKPNQIPPPPPTNPTPICLWNILKKGQKLPQKWYNQNVVTICKHTKFWAIHISNCRQTFMHTNFCDRRTDNWTGQDKFNASLPP
jgi:hypothetical protein